VTVESRSVPIHLRDARPFLAFYLRSRANDRDDTNGADLHALARWVENLPAGEPHMQRIERTETLDYTAGGFLCGPTAARLVETYRAADDAGALRWLDAFTDAVADDA
jgi:hypothetical protein